jgi:hypothetical protein
MGREQGADFDRWLHQQLRSALDPERGPRPRPEAARYATVSRERGGRLIPLRFSISAALGAKGLAGGAAVALAASLAGAVTTHSANPASWGQHVAEAVEQCRAADTNVGRCVSAIAQEHGEQVRAQHSEAVEKATASPSPKPGQREGQENGQGNGNAQGSSGSAQGSGNSGSQGGGTSQGSGNGQGSGHGNHGQEKPTTPHP